MGVDLEPRVEGTVTLADGRRIGFAEFGAPQGRAVLWFHGTPGAKRQIPPAARAAAAELGVRLVGLERPGVGWSSAHVHDSILGWADDVAEVTEQLGIDHFACVGLSGGGPYVLACAVRHPDRMVAGAVLGGVAPTRGDDATVGGVVGLARPLAPLLERVHAPLAAISHRVVRAVLPVRELVFELYLRTWGTTDRAVLGRPEMRAMFLDDLSRAARPQMAGVFVDLVLFLRPWGFELGDVRVPIRFWHGDIDPIVPLHHAEHVAARVPGAELHVRPGTSHLGGLDAAAEVLTTLLADWPADEPDVAAG